ncbi:MAG: hypothetical protein Q8P05_04040 [Candidatus Diapherotrites archaeon]|nr:hypothetical protein [Candidatus Diapherotrites archaeon]
MKSTYKRIGASIHTRWRTWRKAQRRKEAIQVGSKIGEGAQGVIRRGQFFRNERSRPMIVKRFKGTPRTANHEAVSSYYHLKLLHQLGFPTTPFFHLFRDPSNKAFSLMLSDLTRRRNGEEYNIVHDLQEIQDENYRNLTTKGMHPKDLTERTMHYFVKGKDRMISNPDEIDKQIQELNSKASKIGITLGREAFVVVVNNKTRHGHVVINDVAETNIPQKLFPENFIRKEHRKDFFNLRTNWNSAFENAVIIALSFPISVPFLIYEKINEQIIEYRYRREKKGK